MLKRSLMDVCGDIVFHDGIVQSGEYESLKFNEFAIVLPYASHANNGFINECV